METNNKLREAVVLALSLLDLKEGVPYKTISQKDIDFIKAALAAPQRNCDVGTVEEQSKRKMKFCYQQGGCSNCSFSKSATLTQCALAWAQMPYKAQKGGEE